MLPHVNFCNSQEQNHFLYVTAFEVTEKIPAVHINVWAPSGTFLSPRRMYVFVCDCCVRHYGWTCKDEFWKAVWDPVITSFFVQTDRQVLSTLRDPTARLIALSPFRNHFFVWAIVSKQWHLIPNIVAKRAREWRERWNVPIRSALCTKHGVIWWKMNSISLRGFKQNIIHRLNHVNIMSTVMVWLLNNTPPPWGEAPVSVRLDTSLTGTQCLASTLPTSTGRVQSLPSVTPEPAGRADPSDSTSEHTVLGLRRSSEVCVVGNDMCWCCLCAKMTNSVPVATPPCLQRTFLNTTFMCMQKIQVTCVVLWVFAGAWDSSYLWKA